MKWENRDINVAERANILKFSKLDDIVTPLRLLELFFDDVLVDMIVGYTKLYSHREKAGITNIWVVKLLMKQFAYSSAHYCLVSAISFQTVKFIGRRPPILLLKQGLFQCL